MIKISILLASFIHKLLELEYHYEFAYNFWIKDYFLFILAYVIYLEQLYKPYLQSYRNSYHSILYIILCYLYKDF